MPLSRKTLEFLFENKMQNSRDWFHAHKAEYQQYVAQPLQELAGKLLPVVLEIYPHFNPDPRRAVSRINRDTRFSRDKSLYREYMWIAFHPMREAMAQGPGFYFDFSADKISYGCGYYQATPKVMDEMRGMILQQDPLFESARSAAEAQNTFYMDGEFYKRNRYPDEPEPLRNWLERKNISFCCDRYDGDFLFSEDLHEKLAEGFRLLGPVFLFLCEATRRARERDVRP